jgi:hypothetical protein
MKNYVKIIGEAVKCTVLLSASIHVGFLLVYSALHGTFDKLNIFDIFGIDLFFPQLGVGFLNFILSVIFVLVLFILVLVFLTNRRQLVDH